MPEPRLTFIVHGIAQAQLALTTAATLGVPVCLRSAEGAGLALGAPWFAAMIAAATSAAPAADAIAVLDCGPHAGAALAAFRHHVEYVRVELAAPVRMKLAAIAAQCGARLIDDAECDPVIDLDQVANPLSRCQSVLKKPGNR